jgi:hypothetical protein
MQPDRTGWDSIHSLPAEKNLKSNSQLTNKDHVVSIQHALSFYKIQIILRSASNYPPLAPAGIKKEEKSESHNSHQQSNLDSIPSHKDKEKSSVLPNQATSHHSFQDTKQTKEKQK